LADGGRFVIINELLKTEDNIEEVEKLETKLKLKVYTEKELTTFIEKAGFTIANVFLKGKWITIEATKN
jgi:hypothetical protein